MSSGIDRYAADFADMLLEQKRVLQGYVTAAARYGLRPQLEGAIFRIALAWTQCRQGVVDLDMVFSAQDEGDSVIDAIIHESLQREYEQEVLTTLVDAYGARDVKRRAAAGWYEDWEIAAAFKIVHDQSQIEF